MGLRGGKTGKGNPQQKSGGEGIGHVKTKSPWGRSSLGIRGGKRQNNVWASGSSWESGSETAPEQTKNGMGGTQGGSKGNCH